MGMLVAACAKQAVVNSGHQCVQQLACNVCFIDNSSVTASQQLL
jgi:hypothetical protein